MMGVVQDEFFTGNFHAPGKESVSACTLPVGSADLIDDVGKLPFPSVSFLRTGC